MFSVLVIKLVSFSSKATWDTIAGTHASALVDGSLWDSASGMCWKKLQGWRRKTVLSLCAACYHQHQKTVHPGGSSWFLFNAYFIVPKTAVPHSLRATVHQEV